MDIIEDLTNKKTTFSNKISNKLDLIDNIKDLITDDIEININFSDNNTNYNKPDIHADESLQEFIDNHFSFTFIFLLVLSVIFGSFYIVYSINALYHTSHNDIIKFCPDNYLWFYLLSCSTIVKFFYYLSLKGGLLLENKRNCTYYVYAFLFSNVIPIPFGYEIYFTPCINTNFTNKQIVFMSSVDFYMQIIFSILSSYYLVWRFYRKCPIYIKNNKRFTIIKI